MTGSAEGTNGRSEPRGARGRFSSRRKTEAVLRLLHGEELDALSRELGVTAATLAQWRERFLAAGQASLKSRPADDRDEEIRRLQAKVGAITMDNELPARAGAHGGGRTPFGTPEVEAMSRASSPSTARRYGTARVCQLWEVPRSTVYERRARASRPVQPAAKRGPKQAWTDAALTERIRAVLTNSPFLGEGYRKAWARLRLSGVRTSKGRVPAADARGGAARPDAGRAPARAAQPRRHDHHRASRRDVGDRRDRLPHHPRGQRHCLHRRGPLHAGMRWHPCGSSRHALRGAGAAAPGAAGALRRLRRRDRLGSEPAPRPRQPIPERPLPGAS